MSDMHNSVAVPESSQSAGLGELAKWSWWVGIPGQRPIIILALFIFFTSMVLMPVPDSMLALMTEQDPLGASLKSGTHTFTDSYNKLMGSNLTPLEVGQRAKVCVALLFTAALCWGTEAIPLGATNILVGVILYLFTILPLNDIGKAYLKDAVWFIAGVLAVAGGISMTGLDRRIGYLLLGRIKSLGGFVTVFFVLLACAAGFFSEHALVALLCPVLLLVYKAGCEKMGVKHSKHLAVLLFLGICFAANVGGSGSPAVGGRAAVMVGYFSGYDMPISFGQWMMYGLPVVPILALAMGGYLYFAVRRKIPVNINISEVMKENVEGIGPLRGKELRMAVLFGLLVILWIFFSDSYGLGGTTAIICLLMLLSRVMTWKEMQDRVPIDVVLLYAAACAMGVALSSTGGALWVARSFLDLLPQGITEGGAIVIAVSLFTTVITNFMSDGAAVGAIGPVVLPMAAMAGVHLWKVGLACSFSSSYAHAMVVGTVNNAIAYSLARDPETGEQLLSVTDFIVYGLPAIIISLAILWGVAFFGYWNFLPWPS